MRMRVHVWKRPRMASTGPGIGRLKMRSGLRIMRTPALESRKRVFFPFGPTNHRITDALVSGGATAARAAAHRPASGNEEAMVRRPALHVHDAPTSRAARRASRRAGPSWRCGSPISAHRSGIVASVKSPGSHASISSHESGADGVRVWFGPHGIRCRDSPVLRVLVGVEEHAVTFFFPPLARRQIGSMPVHLSRKRQGRAADVAERPPALDAHVDVHAARRTGRFRPADETEISSAPL